MRGNMKMDEWLFPRAIIAAVTIQRAFRRAICDPAYALCRRRLTREFEDMT